MRGTTPIPPALWLTVLFLSSAGSATGAQSVGDIHSAAPRVTAQLLLGAVRVDGRLDERAWALVPPVTRFTQVEPREGADASESTHVRILLTDDALYVGARLFDRDVARVTGRLARRDADTETDLFEIQLDTYHDHRTAFVFGVTPAGAVRDAVIGPDGVRDDSWDPVWEVETTRDSLGWTVEALIRLSQLRFRPGGAAWGIQLVRLISRRQEIDVFAFTPKAEAGGVSRFGHLTGVERLSAPRRLEVRPYGVARAESRPIPPGDPFRRAHEASGAAGVDLRLGLGGDLTLNAAVNPDFGQVEVDPAVVNLTAFETFFAERRPFFVDGSGLFRFGESRADRAFDFSRPFHSRRVGRPPQRSLDADGTSYVDAPHETTIAGAVSLTGRAAGGWTVGLLDAITGRETARFLDSLGERRVATVEPLTNYFVARVRREWSRGGTSLGGITTAVHRQLADSTLRSILPATAWVGGVDLTHAWAGRRWELDASVLVSRIAGSTAAIVRAQSAPARYFQRPDAKGLGVDSALTALVGWVAQAGLTRTAGKHWLGSLAYQEASPGFENNDAGFVRRVNVRGLTAALTYKEDRPGRLVRRYDLTAATRRSWSFDRVRTFSRASLTTRAQLANYWEASVDLQYFPDYQDDRVTRGGPLLLTPAGPGALIEVSSDPRRILSVGGSVFRTGITGDDYQERSANLFVRLRPSPAVELRLEPGAQRNTLTYQYVTTVPDAVNTRTFGARYVFARLEQTELSLVARVDWTLTSRVSLQLFAQPLVSAGRYQDFKELQTPGSFTFDIYGQDVGTIVRDSATGQWVVDPDGGGPASVFRFDDPTFNVRSLRANMVLRWEFRPGSTLFLVWQQRREDFAPLGSFDFGRDYGALLRAPADNVLHLKVAYWIGR